MRTPSLVEEHSASEGLQEGQRCRGIAWPVAGMHLLPAAISPARPTSGYVQQLLALAVALQQRFQPVVLHTRMGNRQGAR